MVEIGSKIKNPKKHISNECLKNKLLAPNLVVPAYILSQGGLKNGSRIWDVKKYVDCPDCDIKFGNKSNVAISVHIAHLNLKTSLNRKKKKVALIVRKQFVCSKELRKNCRLGRSCPWVKAKRNGWKCLQKSACFGFFTFSTDRQCPKD